MAVNNSLSIFISAGKNIFLQSELYFQTNFLIFSILFLLKYFGEILIKILFFCHSKVLAEESLNISLEKSS
jgi:hypothetical protein